MFESCRKLEPLHRKKFSDTARSFTSFPVVLTQTQVSASEGEPLKMRQRGCTADIGACTESRPGV